jgi:hypothetical protein
MTLFFSVRQPLQYQPPEGIFGRDTACVTLPINQLMPARTPALLDFASELVPSADRQRPVR